MVHLRIVAPPDKTDAALEALDSCPTVINVIVLREAAHKPHGDVILCDVAREDPSVVIEDLTGLGIHRDGSIAIALIDTALSAVVAAPVRASAERPPPAPGRARPQPFEPSDAQTSSLVRTRPMTSPVNSLVDAWPPRSGVRTPDAVASSTLS
jgi:hypothetical protein